MTISARQILATLGVLVALTLNALAIWCVTNFPRRTADGEHLTGAFSFGVVILTCSGIAVAISLVSGLVLLADSNPTLTIRAPRWFRSRKVTKDAAGFPVAKAVEK